MEYTCLIVNVIVMFNTLKDTHKYQSTIALYSSQFNTTAVVLYGNGIPKEIDIHCVINIWKVNLLHFLTH